MRLKAGAQNYHVHEYMDLERFAEDTRHMIIFCLLYTSNVIIINCAKVVLTGKKLEQKYLRWHTGWIGHLKESQYSTLMKTHPEKAMEVAVNGMIPDTVIGRKERGRLHVYAGAEHPHAAQKPEKYEL